MLKPNIRNRLIGKGSKIVRHVKIYEYIYRTVVIRAIAAALTYLRKLGQTHSVLLGESPVHIWELLTKLSCIGAQYIVDVKSFQLGTS